LRHGPRARANFNNNARLFQRKGSEHGLREITGAGDNRTNGAEVRYGLYGKRCQIHFLCDLALKFTIFAIQWQWPGNMSSQTGASKCHALSPNDAAKSGCDQYDSANAN
jgi:hypothetical protein